MKLKMTRAHTGELLNRGEGDLPQYWQKVQTGWRGGDLARILSSAFLDSVVMQDHIWDFGSEACVPRTATHDSDHFGGTRILGGNVALGA